MSLYESVFIVRQDVPASQVDVLANELSTIIDENGGRVDKKEFWGLRTLAYRIKKNRKGHYILFNIDAPASAVLEMERVMRLSEDVLRYLSIKVDAFQEGPSAILQQKGEREPRHHRGGPRGPRESFHGDNMSRHGDNTPRHHPAEGA